MNRRAVRREQFSSDFRTLEKFPHPRCKFWCQCRCAVTTCSNKRLYGHIIGYLIDLALERDELSGKTLRPVLDSSRRHAGAASRSKRRHRRLRLAIEPWTRDALPRALVRDSAIVPHNSCRS